MRANMFDFVQALVDISASLILFIAWRLFVEPRMRDTLLSELEPYLPAIFEKIDPYLPDKIKELTATELRTWLYDRIKEVISFSTPEKQKKAVDLVAAVYSPIANAPKIPVEIDIKRV